MNHSRESKQIERLALLEAAIYAAGRPVDVESLKRVVKTRSDRVIQKLVRALAKRYDTRGSSLEIKELPGNRVVLRLRTKFAKVVRRYAKRPLLTTGPLKTLSYVAYHQPVEQTRVAMERGSHVYAHLRTMEQMGLIIREKSSGREVIVRTTPYFADYFGFSHDPIKSRLQLRRMFSRIKITKLNNGNDDSSKNMMTEPSMPPQALAEVDGSLHEGLAEYTSPNHRGSQ